MQDYREASHVYSWLASYIILYSKTSIKIGCYTEHSQHYVYSMFVTRVLICMWLTNTHILRPIATATALTIKVYSYTYYGYIYS